MQDFELRVPRLIDHAAREHGAREIVTAWADGSETRTNWAGIAPRCAQAGAGAGDVGVKPGDRVATLAMNHGHHLVAWYGAIGMGGVIHTINPRLFDEQLVYIANHAEDRVLFYDKAVPADRRPAEAAMDDDRALCLLRCDGRRFEALLDAEDGDYRLGRRAGARALHALLHQRHDRQSQGRALRASLVGDPRHGRGRAVRASICRRSTVALPIVPMFHAAAWGLPFAGALAGIKFVYSQVNDPVRAVPADERGEGHPFGRRADRLARACSSIWTRPARRPQHLQHRHHRRLGRAARDDRAADEDGHPRRPCLGDDRDLADRHDRRAAGQLGRAELRRAGRSRRASRAGCRSASSCAWSTTTARSSRATARARAGCRSAGPG